MKVLWFVFIFVVVVSGCLNLGNSRLMDSYENARMRDLVELHIKRTPTYQMGGNTLRQISMFNVNCGLGNEKGTGKSQHCWDAIYSFVSDFEGYGYREHLIRKKTNHTIKVKLKDDIVTYSVIDEKWDTLSQTEI